MGDNTLLYQGVNDDLHRMVLGGVDVVLLVVALVHHDRQRTEAAGQRLHCLLKEFQSQ